MAAEFESGVFVREVPWHGLGTIVEDAPTSKDAIVLAGLNWNVVGQPIYDQFGNEIPGYKANVRDSDNSVLGIVTNKYKVIQNLEAFSFTDSLINEDVHYEAAGSLRKGKTIWLLAKMPERKILDDKFDPYVCFTNSHDGTGAIKVCCTPIRVVCMNTLNLALSRAKRTWSTKHMGDLNSKLIEARHTLGLANDYMDELAKQAEVLSEVKVSDITLEGILNSIYPVDVTKDSERKLRNVNQIKENFFRCYDMSDISQYKGTAWGIMNAMSDMVTHIAPVRMTSTYQENMWGKVMSGHPDMDKMLKLVAA